MIGTREFSMLPSLCQYVPYCNLEIWDDPPFLMVCIHLKAHYLYTLWMLRYNM